MKKVSALLLTTMLGSSMVFASFSGSATLGLDYNFDDSTYGFANDTDLNFNVNALEQVNDATTSDKAVYAEINATLYLKLVNGDDDGVTENDPDSSAIMGIGTSIDSAMIYGDNWSVDITGVDGSPDFAVSALDSEEVDNEKDTDWTSIYWGDTDSATPGSLTGAYLVTEDYDDYYTYETAFEDDAPGFDATFDYINFGMGIDGKDSDVDFLVYAGVSDFALSDSLTLSALAEYTQIKYSGDSTVYGASAKVSYASDDLALTVATDMGYDVDATADNFGMDLAANASYKFVTMDAYYAIKAEADSGDADDDVTNANDAIDTLYKENLLSMQFVTDLTAFDMPFTVTLLGQDLVNKQDLEVSVDYMVTDMLTLTVTGDYGIEDEDWTAALDVDYTFDYGTVAAGVSYDSDELLAMSASIENTTMIDNATLTLEWADADDLLNNTADTDTTDFGSITASCEIAF